MSKIAELSKRYAAMALAPCGGNGGMWIVLIGIGYYMVKLSLSIAPRVPYSRVWYSKLGFISAF